MWYWLIRIDGNLTMSTSFADWGDCYDDYCDNMKGISDLGHADFRGVYNAEETMCITNAHMKGEHIGDALMLLSIDTENDNG